LNKKQSVYEIISYFFYLLFDLNFNVFSSVVLLSTDCLNHISITSIPFLKLIYLSWLSNLCMFDAGGGI